MGKIKHELWTFAKAEMSASVSSCVDFGLAVSLTFLELFTYGYANIIGVVCGGLTNFTLNCQYVFSHTGRGKKSLAESVIVKCLVALAVAFGFNYPLQRGWVFKHKTMTEEDK